MKLDIVSLVGVVLVSLLRTLIGLVLSAGGLYAIWCGFQLYVHGKMNSRRSRAQKAGSGEALSWSFGKFKGNSRGLGSALMLTAVGWGAGAAFVTPSYRDGSGVRVAAEFKALDEQNETAKREFAERTESARRRDADLEKRRSLYVLFAHEVDSCVEIITDDLDRNGMPPSQKPDHEPDWAALNKAIADVQAHSDSNGNSGIASVSSEFLQECKRMWSFRKTPFPVIELEKIKAGFEQLPKTATELKKSAYNALGLGKAV